MRVFLSSTSIDLKDYRQVAIRVLQRLGAVPVNMEEFPPADESGVQLSLRKVEESDLYIGIFAHRYGYVPKSEEISVTEMEYLKAGKLGLKRIIFCVDPDFSWPPKYFDFENQAKLQSFLTRVREAHTVRTFTTAESLKEDLLLYLPKELEAEGETRSQPKKRESTMIVPPAIFAPSKYSLLQVAGVIGRQKELKQLNQWAAAAQRQPICCVVGIGGQGKSALTWQWFSEDGYSSVNELEGRIWWSFYESESSFEDFVTRSLAYTLSREPEELKPLSLAEKCDQLISILDTRKFILCLDGFERLLNAYMRMDAARLPDEHAMQVQGLPSRRSKEQRRTADLRAGRFLEALKGIKQSRVLISTRLFPVELEDAAGRAHPASLRVDLDGLTDEDAMLLWKAFVANGTAPAELLPLFRTFDKHPLLIQTLAGEVAHFRGAPGDYEAWKQANSTFTPFQLPVAQRRSHVLSHAMSGMSETARTLLALLSAFRMAVPYGTIRELVVPAQIESEQALVNGLEELEDRNLVGWDRESNRYDLHPLVRGVTWSQTERAQKRGILEAIASYYQNEEWRNRFGSTGEIATDNITALVERYHALLGLGRKDEAARLGHTIWTRVHDQMGSIRETVELLTSYFEGGAGAVGEPDVAASEQDESICMLYLGKALFEMGLFEQAFEYLRRHNRLCEEDLCLAHQALVWESAGSLAEYDLTMRQVLTRTREHGDDDNEARVLAIYGMDLLDHGRMEEVVQIVARLKHLIGVETISSNVRNVIRDFQLRLALEKKQAASASRLVRQWSAHADDPGRKKSQVKMVEAAIAEIGGKGDAKPIYIEALDLARRAGLPATEVSALLSLAELGTEAVDWTEVRECIDRADEILERIPYRSHLARCELIRARMLQAQNQMAESKAAVNKAYQYAWCDGPPYCYAPLLEECRSLMRSVGVEEPQLPMKGPDRTLWPDILLNPPDERKRVRRGGMYRDLADSGFGDWLEREENYYDLYRRIDECLADDDYLGAIYFADRLVAQRPDDSTAVAKRAMCLWYGGELWRALGDYTQLIEDHRLTEHFSNRLQIHAELGNSEEAMLDSERVEDLQMRPYALSGVGLALGTLGRYEEAFAAFERSVELAPTNGWVYFNRARIHELRGDVQRMKEDLQLALEQTGPKLPPYKTAWARMKLVES